MKLYKTKETDLGIIYTRPTGHRLDSDGRIVADFLIWSAPNELKKEIGKYNTYRIKDMEVVK
ncbi:MAG: hypothetical protein CMF74_06820 [Maricaulis sp.]|nr:hypothetical protein [Maricaulis sp.]